MSSPGLKNTAFVSKDMANRQDLKSLLLHKTVREIAGANNLRRTYKSSCQVLARVGRRKEDVGGREEGGRGVSLPVSTTLRGSGFYGHAGREDKALGPNRRHP